MQPSINDEIASLPELAVVNLTYTDDMEEVRVEWRISEFGGNLTNTCEAFMQVCKGNVNKNCTNYMLARNRMAQLQKDIKRNFSIGYASWGTMEDKGERKRGNESREKK